jgi:glycosyltransferase involved in cell wall biosynthesis
VTSATDRTGAPALVIASSYGAAGASTRVRALDWLRYLGLEAEVLGYLGTPNVRPGTLARHPLGTAVAERALRRLRRRDAMDRLFVSRSMGPFTGGRLEAELLRRARWGVYDFDDALQADRGLIHRYFGESAGWATAVGGADLVVAGNEYLADAAARINPNVEVIPSCVDPDAYPEKQSYAVASVPRLVWLGSPATEPYLDRIAPALVRVHRRTGARLTLVSRGRRALGELAPMTDRVDWAGERTNGLLAAADCGLMPLPDDPWTRGKCAYKLLEYAAAGLPAVGSPVGVNAQVIGRLGGYSATDLDSWEETLVDVLEASEDERRARGARARRGVEEHYSFAAWREPFLRALRLPDPVASPTTSSGPAAPATR